MNKIVTIDYPFDMVTFDLRPLFEQASALLTLSQWAALEKAEEPLFKNEYGAHAYTSVIRREEAYLAKQAWDHCERHLDDELDGKTRGDAYNAVIARRVARVLGVAAFGEDWLLR